MSERETNPARAHVHASEIVRIIDGVETPTCADCEAREAALAALQAEVREWICLKCRYVYPGPPQPGLECVLCTRCDGNTMPHMSAQLADERGKLKVVEADAAYLRWRLDEIMPLFEEARDALPAITQVNARLRNVRLDLSDRMDRAGTRTRADFDALHEEIRK